MERQFEKIKTQFQHRVFSYAYYSLRITEDAEDIAQEAFIRLWQNWHTIEPVQLGNWLMRVTHNLIVDQVRSQRSRIDSSDEDTNQIIQIEDDLNQKNLKSIVESSIAKLSDPYRTTMVLREMQGMSYQDIAEVLIVSTDQVKTDLFRAKRKLREIVKQHPLYSEELLQMEPAS